MKTALLDETAIEIMKEIAIMEGKRMPDGSWNIDDTVELARLLHRACEMKWRIEDKAKESQEKAI